MQVPSIELLSHEEQVYVDYLISRRVPAGEAREQVKESMQALFTRAWFQGLREMLLNRAAEYIKMYPELNLRGFDPEELQVAYMPGENTGREGKQFVRVMLAEMARRVR